jgi:hypothetical protein
MHRYLPCIKWHHLTILQNNSCSRYAKDLYLVDFTPLEDTTNLHTMIRMGLGQRILGEIRIRKFVLPKRDRLALEPTLDSKSIIDLWTEQNEKLTVQESIKTTQKTYNSVVDPEMKEFLDWICQWNTDFYIYTHNCQHFAKRVLS